MTIEQNKSPPHTPGPYFHNDNGLISAAPSDPEGEDYPIIADTASEPGLENDRDRANANFIVRACNSHYELLEAVEMAFFALGRGGGNTIGSEHRPVWEKARAAIAKARNGAAT